MERNALNKTLYHFYYLDTPPNRRVVFHNYELDIWTVCTEDLSKPLNDGLNVGRYSFDELTTKDGITLVEGHETVLEAIMWHPKALRYAVDMLRTGEIIID